MNKEEIAKMRRGLMCCIEANQTHQCPAECPYEDETISGAQTYCEGVLLMDVKAYIMQLERVLRLMKEKTPARLFRPEELPTYCGAAWLETWFEPYEDEPESKELSQVGVCNGHLVHGDGDFTDCKYLLSQYNRHYGLRLWTQEPTDQQRECVAWNAQN